MTPKKILLGTVVGVISSATQSLGLTLQRKSHIQEDLVPITEHRRPPYKRALWRLGFLLFLAANLLGSSIQITTLPLIILSPLQAVGLVFNSICSAAILDEGFTAFSICGTVLVAAGALAIAGFGSIEEPNHSLEELVALMGRAPFVLWICSSCTACLLVLLWIQCVGTIHSTGYEVGNLARGLQYLVDVPCQKLPFVKGCLYGIVSGILSAHSLLLAKSAVELILNALVRSNFDNFGNYRCWLIIASFFIIAITQLIFLNKGLRFVSTSVLYPLVFCVYNVVNIANGLVFYNQIHILSHFQIWMIGLGTVLVLLGVLFLSWRLEDHFEAKEASFIGEHSGLLSPVCGDSERTGYISFGSPSGEALVVASKMESPDSSRVFNYGPTMDTGLNQQRGKRRSKRVLSYEQTELLTQLNQME